MGKLVVTMQHDKPSPKSGHNTYRSAECGDRAHLPGPPWGKLEIGGMGSG